ncbi:ECF RNA polymerase sigma factor SigW [Paenibacillus dendritiformis]|uniref:RNA polymerase sigma factor n=1 Tax=Paenibacillus dendritiformis TaxID=130049 RepID=UPI001B01F335|nr:RNA polymerase sigma factor [Paenibacillus dendritiformis]GIO72772.1 ECF RNA polymerase sigma factor SigW [Paenibacillus dendritiformis]
MDGIEEKVIQVQAGDVHEYACIVERFQQPLYLYCTRLLGNRQEAEDAVQEALVKAYEKIHLYRPVVGFSSWLYKIAYHHCLNLLRRRQLQRKITSLFRQEGLAPSAEQAITEELFDEPLASAWLSLSGEERSLVVLRVFEEKSFEEIGIIMNKNREAVKKRYGRIRQKLKSVIGESEVRETCVNSAAAMKMRRR